MGGCRCIFRDCDMSTYRNRSLSFFHFPTKEPQRYERWIRLAKAQFVRDLPRNKQKNRVICARHFRDECFMNYKKNSLTRLATPSIWRLSKNIAFDYENNIEFGELVTLEPPTQTHLIPPAEFICPLGFSDNDDFLNEKLTEMNAVMAQYDSTNNDELGMNTTEQKSTKKRRLSQVMEKDVQINKVSTVLNGTKAVPVSNIQNVYITENEDIGDIKGDVAEKNALTDILPVSGNLFTLIRESAKRDNVDNDQSLEQEDENDDSQTTTGNLSDQTEDYFEEQFHKFVASNTTLNVNIENDESNKYSERERSLNERIKVLENDVSEFNGSLAKAHFDLEVKKMELKECVKKNLELEQQMQQHKDEYQKLQKQLKSVKDQNQKMCQVKFKKQEHDKINRLNLTLTQEYENLQRENRELLEKCEKLEKLQYEHQQEQQVSTISTTKTNQCPSSATSYVNPDIVTKGPLPKVQLFNTIKRYVSVTMASLLRMEMFGNADRTWQPDERQIAVDILRLGDSVYKYFVEEWRFRLPPMHETRSWLIQSLDNNAAVDDEDV